MQNQPVIHFNCLLFSRLSLQQLYDLMALRQEVFVVEQDCPFLDADGIDQEALHVLGYSNNNELLAYSRIIPKGVLYPDFISIGRIVTALSVRGSGLGRALVHYSLQEAFRHYGNEAIKISAQSYLTRFYESFGFETVGEEYMEDGILHVEMIRPGETAKPQNRKMP